MGSPCSILLIEDSPHIASLLKDAATLYEPGCFQITHALDIMEGARKFQAFPYDLLILDLGLQQTDGIATLLALRSFVDAKVPVAVLTGLDDEEVEVRCIEGGAVAYVVKPVLNAHHFLRRCRGWILKHKRDMEELRILTEKNRILEEAAKKIPLEPLEAQTEVRQVAEALFALADSIEIRYKGQVAHN